MSDTSPTSGPSEFGLIAELAPFLSAGGEEGIAVGHGDDAAVLDLGDRWVCLAVDVLVEDVHFRRDLSSPEDVGWKAVAVNCSDIAAMGATPSAAVVGLCRPADVPAEELSAIYAGMDAACEEWGLRLVGGDTVAAEALALSVTILGEVEPGAAVTRGGAGAGEVLVVVGPLGAAAAALAQVAGDREPSEHLLAAHRRPRALVEAGRVLAAHGATAMIDVSDGLGADLGHLCEASGVAARIRWDDLPLAEGVGAVAAQLGLDVVTLACGGGEDFALLAALPAEAAQAAAEAAGRAEGVAAAVVGILAEPRAGHPAVQLLMADGDTRDLAGFGYDHYKKQV